MHKRMVGAKNFVTTQFLLFAVRVGDRGGLHYTCQWSSICCV